MKDECPFCGSANVYHNGANYECLDCRRKYSEINNHNQRNQDDEYEDDDLEDKFDDDFDFEGNDDFDIEDEEYFDDEDF